MYFCTGQLITRPKVVAIPITGVVIKAAKNKSEEQGFRSLNFIIEKRKKLFT